MSVTLSIWTIAAIYILIGMLFAEASDFAGKRANRIVSTPVYLLTMALWTPLLIILAIRNRS